MLDFSSLSDAVIKRAPDNTLPFLSLVIIWDKLSSNWRDFPTAGVLDRSRTRAISALSPPPPHVSPRLPARVRDREDRPTTRTDLWKRGRTANLSPGSPVLIVGKRTHVGRLDESPCTRDAACLQGAKGRCAAHHAVLALENSQLFASDFSPQLDALVYPLQSLRFLHFIRARVRSGRVRRQQFRQ